jgi:hypothetical protein
MTTVLRHEIWETTANPRGYPIVVHEFRGNDKKEAFAVYEAHLKTDAFLSGCVEHGEFIAGKNKIKCQVSWWFEEDVKSFDKENKERLPDPRTGFSPRVIDGGLAKQYQQQMKQVKVKDKDLPLPPLPGHEDHDPDVCDVRTG